MLAEWEKGQRSPGAGKPYAQEPERGGPVRRVAMPRAHRLYAPETTVHVVARCNNREFYFTTPEDFDSVLGKLRGMVRDYEQRAYAALLVLSADPRADGHDARWTTKRAVGSLAFLARHGARRGQAAKMAAPLRNR